VVLHVPEEPPYHERGAPAHCLAVDLSICCRFVVQLVVQQIVQVEFGLVGDDVDLDRPKLLPAMVLKPAQVCSIDPLPLLIQPTIYHFICAILNRNF